MPLGDFLRSVKDSLRGGWSPVGTVIIAVSVVVGLMAVGVLHVYLKSRGIVVTAGVERAIVIDVGGDETVSARGIALMPGSVARLRGAFDELGFNLAPAGGSGGMTVPRVFVSPLPDDLKSVRSTDVRKKLFLQSLLPQVLLVNDIILADRARLEKLRKTIEAGKLGNADRRWLAGLKARYGIKSDDIDAMLRRVDAVPVALALAQAAIESGWGTSRFAREGNALFGQWTWARRGGLVPKDRIEGASHSIRAFRQITDSVWAYVHNLNTHKAYRRFRDVRAAIREAGGKLDSLTLATTLDRYSQRGEAYVTDLRDIIRRNRLGRFETAALTARTCRLADAGSGGRAMLIRVPTC